jgi:hypothetical protein
MKAYVDVKSDEQFDIVLVPGDTTAMMLTRRTPLNGGYRAWQKSTNRASGAIRVRQTTGIRPKAHPHRLHRYDRMPLTAN